MFNLRKKACALLCLATALLTLPGCETVDALLQSMPKPTATLDSLSLGNISLQDATVNIAVKVNNPLQQAFDNPMLGQGDSDSDSDSDGDEQKEQGLD